MQPNHYNDGMEYIKPATIAARIRRGWTERAARETPVVKQSSLPEGQYRCSRCKNILPVAAFCPRKGRPGQHQPHCRECDKKRSRDARRLARARLISHYSNKTNQCAICGEDRFDVLDIDHIHGGGIQDRASHKTIHQYYLRLLRELPVGLRVLCRNCNWLEWRKRQNEQR